MGPKPPICQNSHSNVSIRARGDTGRKRPVFFREIEQDTTGFEHRDRLSVRPVMVDDRGNLVVRADLQELGRELFALVDGDIVLGIFELCLLPA